jgi:hypothetical protein
MRDVYEILRTKEMLIKQLTREIEALRLVAPLLADDTDAEPPANAQSVRSEQPAREAHPPKEPDRGRASTRRGIRGDEVLRTAQKISGRIKRLARPVLDAVNPLANDPKAVGESAMCTSDGQ